MKSVTYRNDERMTSPELIEKANESLMIVAPAMNDEMLAPLFALSRPLDVNVLTSRAALEDGGRQLRVHLKQLQDINHNVDVRVTDERFPAFAVVDGEHVHCHSPSSKRMAANEPESLLEAAESLWERSKPLVSRHLND